MQIQQWFWAVLRTRFLLIYYYLRLHLHHSRKTSFNQIRRRAGNFIYYKVCLLCLKGKGPGFEAWELSNPDRNKKSQIRNYELHLRILEDLQGCDQKSHKEVTKP
jgi:hypothetical protein